MNSISRLAKVAAAILISASRLFAASEEPRTPSVLTVYHFWKSPSETAAIQSLMKLFTGSYPEVAVTGSLTPRGKLVQSLFYTVKDKQPDSFQMYAGYGAQVYYDAGLLSPIDDLWASEKLEDVIPPVVRNLSQFEGHYYSVPVNVHRTNVLWYNKSLLDKNRIDPESLTTWEALFAAADKLRAAGVKSPIELGVSWTVTTVFEAIMASQGIGAYEDWMNGKISSPDDPRLVKAWTILRRYLTYVNADHDHVDWDVAARRVMNGEGAFYIMGDWANGEFHAAHQELGRDYGAIPVPGTQGMFGLGIDTFLHPKTPSDPTNAIRWLRLVASRNAQDTFNPLKGSISARSDSERARYDAYQRTAMADFKSARYMYPSLGAAFPEAFAARVQDAVSTFCATPDVGRAAATVAQASAQLAHARKWQLRLARYSAR